MNIIKLLSILLTFILIISCNKKKSNEEQELLDKIQMEAAYVFIDNDSCLHKISTICKYNDNIKIICYADTTELYSSMVKYFCAKCIGVDDYKKYIHIMARNDNSNPDGDLKCRRCRLLRESLSEWKNKYSTKKSFGKDIKKK